MSDAALIVDPLPSPLPTDRHELDALRQLVANAQAVTLSDLRIAQQQLHSALRACGAVVHARLDLKAVEALEDADHHARRWSLYHDQSVTLAQAIGAQLQREQTGGLF